MPVPHPAASPGFTPPGQWSSDAVATTTTHDLPTVAGWWRGTDIVWRDRIGQTAARADGRDPVRIAQAERAADRDALWAAFQRAGIAPAGVAPPPLDNAPVDEALVFIGATPAPLVTCPLEDLLALAEQPNLPGSVDEHPNWRRRLAQPIDELFLDPTFCDRLLAVDQSRANAPTKPPGPPRLAMTVPHATLRLQFHQGFTFDDALAHIEYFDALGISHIYASPITTAAPGSTHGYKHRRLHPGERGVRRRSGTEAAGRCIACPRNGADRRYRAEPHGHRRIA